MRNPRRPIPYLVGVPRSHICPSCLTELARVRPITDPHYGLPIVVCPGCTTACVRTPHPDQQFWRSVRRFRQGLRQLFLAMLLTALSIGALIGMSFSIMPIFTDRRAMLLVPVGPDPEDSTTVLVAAAVVLLCGLAIRAVYAHHRFWAAWLVLMVPTAFFISIDASIGRLLRQLADIIHSGTRIDVPANNEIARRYESLLLVTLVATGGMLAGSLLNRYIERGSGRRIVKIRRGLRKQRARQD